MLMGMVEILFEFMIPTRDREPYTYFKNYGYRS